MKQTKIETILIFIILILYYILSQIYFMKLGNIYTMVINPLFWILLFMVLKMYIKKPYANTKYRREILDYTLIAILAYIIVYLFSGSLVSFGKNPYSITFKGLLINLWVTGSIVLTKEYVRYLIINNVYEKQKKKVCILIIVIMTLLDINIFNVSNLNSYYIFKQVASVILPILSKNILFTYMMYCKNYISAICYDLLLYLVLWLSPVLPNMPWFMVAVIDITAPIILLLYIRYAKMKKEHYKSREIIDNTEPKYVITLVIVVVFAIWFALGIFPIKPISVATESMFPIINRGDVAIIKKSEPDDIEVGDIIEFKDSNITIVHRVVSIKQQDGRYYFKTKGDNNDKEDKNLVTEEQIVGKYLFKIRYLGYPAIWLTELRNQK